MENNDAIIDDPKKYGKKIVSKSIPKPNIGIEDKYTIVNDILKEPDTSNINYSALNSFIEATRKRDTQYDIIDQMCQDSIPAAILEQFTEDTTATNENKAVVWVTSDDPKIAKTVQYYLDSLQVDKNIYAWANSFIKYGDVYLKLYKRSEYQSDDDLFGEKQNLNEDINLHINAENDKFVNFVELIENPATVFELRRFGKTAGYIQTKDDTTKNIFNNMLSLNGSTLQQYSIHKNDVNLYQPDHFVHASLDDNIERTTEEVKILLDDEENTSISYKVKKGHSLFFNVFKIWRELSLLENSLILSRITKSSITRVIQVETGQTAKEETGNILQRLKEMIEQKSALNPGSNMAEYTNPGPMENNIYMATHDGKGAITTSQIGGDYDPKALTDIDYFKNAFYGSFGIPKQWFGDTDDGAGFNGGQSLTILSAKYAKKVIKIQKALTEMITSLINILLIDRQLSNYVNKFTINMLAPVTQEDLDRRDAIDRQLQNIQDVMGLLSDIDDPKTKLGILKSLLSNIINNNEVMTYIDDEIAKLEAEEENKSNENSKEKYKSNENIDEISDERNINSDIDDMLNLQSSESEIIKSDNETILPTPGETGVDLINNID